MPMIKAIETVYAGYRFRSRLEARWAVFFDTLGIEYRYEHQDYMVDCMVGSRRYLADFWLPKQKRWIEIKGQEPTASEIEKAQGLFVATGYPVGLFHGLPGDDGGEVFCCRANDGGGGHTHLEDIGWSECAICGTVDIYLRWDDDWHIYNEQTGESVNACNCKNVLRFLPNPRCSSRCPFSLPCPSRCAIVDDGQKSTRLIEAYTAARSARFEHGEHGRA